MDQFISKVINLTPIADNYFSLSFKWYGSGYPLAGQFLTIKTTELSTPLLRRPFALSAYNKDNKEASIIFQIRGSGTKLLSELQINEELDILGPLGNSFSDYVNVQGNSNKKPVIVAGGIGTGPMLYLTDELKSAGFSPLLIIGCRTKSLIPFTALDKNIETVICTDDGSYGFHGNVVEYMKSRLDISSDAII